VLIACPINFPGTAFRPYPLRSTRLNPLIRPLIDLIPVAQHRLHPLVWILFNHIPFDQWNGSAETRSSLLSLSLSRPGDLKAWPEHIPAGRRQ